MASDMQQSIKVNLAESKEKKRPKKKKDKSKSTKDGPKKNKTKHHLKLRNLHESDYGSFAELMDTVYANSGGAWTREQFLSQLSHFPDGQFCLVDKGKLVSAVISMIVDYKQYGDNHTHTQITADGYLTTHDPRGDTLYGVDVFVHPDYRGLRLGRRMYDARKELCRKLNLRRIIYGGRIPNYDHYCDTLTPQQYIDQVKSKEIHDPVLTFQLHNDFHVRRVIKGYLPEDEESHSYAVIGEWINIDYEPPSDHIHLGEAKRVIRVGAVQWQMRPASNFEELRVQLKYFVHVVAEYEADFVLLPEYFNASLMAQFHPKSDRAAVVSLADFTDPIREYLCELAVQNNINIIAGSMPLYESNALYNVSYLCRRDGTWDSQYKLHPTPDEEYYWGLKGGNQLKVFDTDEGKIGILICYDSEFPELPRLLAEQGMQVLFIPYLTDTKSSYLRVRRCAQARAIENECYVVITGSMGNIPNIAYMDIHYSQSAIFTPADFAFPHDAVKAEATPNTETTLIADLDLGLLKELRTRGAVRNLSQRRLDLYRVEWTGPNALGGDDPDSSY